MSASRAGGCIAFVLVVCAAGCGASFPRVGTVDDEVAPSAVTLEIGCENEPSAPLVLRGAELRESKLLLDVTHSGGCAEHAYRVCGAPVILETDPGQWVVTVLHDARGDTCTEAVHRVLQVHLDRHTPVNVSNIHERSLTVWVR